MNINAIVKKSKATTVARLLVSNVAGKRQMAMNGATATTQMTSRKKILSIAKPALIVVALHLPLLELPPF